MRSYSISARGLSAVQVRGANWIMALGSGLELLGRAADVQRLACEVLPNGTVIARDIKSGTGYIVQEVDLEVEDVAPVVEDEIELLPADAIELVSEDDDEQPFDAIRAADTAIAASHQALEVAREQVGAESGAVILEDKGYLRFSAVTGPHARKLVGVRLPLGTGVAGFAMEKRRSVVVADAREDPRHCGEVDALTGYVTRQIAVVPVLADERVLGVLELMNLPDGRRFTEDDVNRLAEVAEVLGERLAHG